MILILQQVEGPTRTELFCYISNLEHMLLQSLHYCTHIWRDITANSRISTYSL